MNSLIINKRTIAGIIISVLCVVLIIYLFDFEDVIGQIVVFPVHYLLFLLILYCLGIVLRVMRWKVIINPGSTGMVSFTDALGGLGVGYMANSLLPVKIGEIVRVVYLGKKRQLSKSYLFGTVVVERFLDIGAVFLFLSFSVVFSDTMQAVFSYNLSYLLIFFVTAILFLVLVIKTNVVFLIINALPDIISGRILKMYELFLQSFQLIKHKQSLFYACLITILIWLVIALISFIILYGLGIVIPYYAYFFVVSAGVLGMAIPSTSGGVGVYHAVSTGALLLFVSDKDIAFSYALISHAVDFFPNIFLGFVILIKNDFSLKDVVIDTGK